MRLKSIVGAFAALAILAALCPDSAVAQRPTRSEDPREWPTMRCLSRPSMPARVAHRDNKVILEETHTLPKGSGVKVHKFRVPYSWEAQVTVEVLKGATDRLSINPFGASWSKRRLGAGVYRGYFLLLGGGPEVLERGTPYALSVLPIWSGSVTYRVLVRQVDRGDAGTGRDSGVQPNDADERHRRRLNIRPIPYPRPRHPGYPIVRIPLRSGQPIIGHHGVGDRHDSYILPYVVKGDKVRIRAQVLDSTSVTGKFAGSELTVGASMSYCTMKIISSSLPPSWSLRQTGYLHKLKAGSGHPGTLSDQTIPVPHDGHMHFSVSAFFKATTQYRLQVDIIPGPRRPPATTGSCCR